LGSDGSLKQGEPRELGIEPLAPALTESRGSPPDELAVPVNFADAMKRYLPHLGSFVHQFKDAAFAFRKDNVLQSDSMNRALLAVEITDLEPTLAKLPVMTDAGQQFVDRCHGRVFEPLLRSTYEFILKRVTRWSPMGQALCFPSQPQTAYRPGYSVML